MTYEKLLQCHVLHTALKAKQIFLCQVPAFRTLFFNGKFQEGIVREFDLAILHEGSGKAKLLFFKGLCYTGGLEISSNARKACQNFLEAAVFGYQPAKYTSRRIREALFSIEELFDIEADIERSISNIHALKHIDKDIYESLDQIECQNGSDYLSAAIRFSQGRISTEKCIKLASADITVLDNKNLLSENSAEIRRRFFKLILNLMKIVNALIRMTSYFLISWL